MKKRAEWCERHIRQERMATYAGKSVSLWRNKKTTPPMNKTLIITAAAAAALAGCTSTNKGGETQPAPTKSLIVYYSQTGSTKTVAEALQKETGADMEAIEAVVPYNGDFEQTIKRCQDEMVAGTMAEIKPLTVKVADYDTIYIGYPVWFGTFAPPVATLLKTVDLEGKVLVPFCTFGSGGLINTVASLRADFPKSTVLDGYGVRAARIAQVENELPQHLINVGIKPGTPVVLPDFSEQAELTDDEKAAFDAACGDYPMPLGTPVSVGNRKIGGGTEYLFTVKSQGGPGAESVAKIHVVVSDSANVKPEFTLVER